MLKELHGNNITLKGDFVENYCYFKIYLNSTEEVIGMIQYAGDNPKQFGSVGYFIVQYHRHKGYAYEAVLLLSDYLNQNGIENISIVTSKNNTASIRLAEKLGGVLDYEDEWNYSYVVDIRRLNKEQATIKKEHLVNVNR